MTMKRSLLIVPALVVLVVLAYGLRGPYVWPVSLAPGPCLKDYTSPNSWSDRASPLRETRVEQDGRTTIICYGAPLVRDRALFGPDALLPYGRPWRLGANEPTRLLTDRPVILGGLRVPPGRWSLYAEPDSATWRIFVSGSTWHWGNRISTSVRDQEIGSFTAAVRVAPSHAETLRVALEADLLAIHWGRTLATAPLRFE